jgi:hypothetical protein
MMNSIPAEIKTPFGNVRQAERTDALQMLALPLRKGRKQ